ncbi:uncharacterized protein DS421_20g693790 [Arachis hypogaea]|nr:uncharacterized protein DS421_20g693790 [Arachis hypogaea]
MFTKARQATSEEITEVDISERRATNDKRLTMAMKNDFAGGGGGDSTATKTILL